VIPDPAATHRCRSPAAASARHEPFGARTSIRVPGSTSRTSQVDKSPSGISRTPMRSGAPTGAQIE
jgi:hypothetical protein